MTDSKHTNDNNSLFTRIQVKSPCADERYSAGNSLARLMTRIHADAVNKARPERNYTKAYRIWLAAASLMIVFLTSGWLATALRPAPEMLIRNNAWEKVENLTLADGTQLTLNRGAQLIYPEKFAGRTREIFLSGEAYFDVAHDKNILYRSGRGSEDQGVGYEIQYRGLPRFGDHHHHAAGGFRRSGEPAQPRVYPHGSQPAALV